MQYEAVIGLEVHVHLKTKTKAFCGCSTEYGNTANTQTCPVCLGLPGSLPVLNELALEYALKVALALNCTVQKVTKFDRKHYYYPDLPKNYQISQYDMPIALNGHIEIEEPQKKIKIKRVHFEEDAGKLIHQDDGASSLVDFNRCGMPLLEIVSEPDINSPQEAFEYLKNLKLIIQYLGVSDCDMEKGSLRCDANISLRPKGDKELGVKTELKNMNSFKWVREGLAYEIERQAKLLESGKNIEQETRLWDEKKLVTNLMRIKEGASDYRYFPEPDLTPFLFKKDYIEQLKAQLPESPQDKKRRFEKYDITSKGVQFLIDNIKFGEIFDKCCKLGCEPKKVCNWLIGVVASASNSGISISYLELNPEQLVKLIKYVDTGKLNNLAAKDVLKTSLEKNMDIDEIIKEKGVTQISDEGELGQLVEKVIKDNTKSVNDYLSGKENALMFLVGQTMKLSKGKANPKIVKEMLRGRLKNES